MGTLQLVLGLHLSREEEPINRKLFSRTTKTMVWKKNVSPVHIFSLKFDLKQSIYGPEILFFLTSNKGWILLNQVSRFYGKLVRYEIKNWCVKFYLMNRISLRIFLLSKSKHGKGHCSKLSLYIYIFFLSQTTDKHSETLLLFSSFSLPQNTKFIINEHGIPETWY